MCDAQKETGSCTEPTFAPSTKRVTDLKLLKPKRPRRERKSKRNQISGGAADGAVVEVKPRAASKWIKAAQACGYLVKGAFKPLPKKGSSEYQEIVAKAASMS